MISVVIKGLAKAHWTPFFPMHNALLLFIHVVMHVFLLSSLKNEGLYDGAQTINMLCRSLYYGVFLIHVSDIPKAVTLRCWYVINPYYILARLATFSKPIMQGDRKQTCPRRSSGACEQDVGCRKETAGSSACSPSTIASPAVSSISVSAYLLCSKNTTPAPIGRDRTLRALPRDDG